MAKTLCDLKKALLKEEPKAYMKLVNKPTCICTKCGRAANDKKLLCNPTKIQH